MLKPSDSDWDQVWIGANIATMAGTAPYGSIDNAALAIKGERIAWIGAAAEGQRRAQTQRISIHDADQDDRPRADVEGGKRKKLTDNHLCFWRVRTFGDATLLTGKIQVASPDHAPGQAPVRRAQSPEQVK